MFPTKNAKEFLCLLKFQKIRKDYYVLDLQELFTNSADSLFTDTAPHLYVYE